MLKLTSRNGNEFWTFDSVAEVTDFVKPEKVEAYMKDHSFLGRKFSSYDDLDRATKSLWDEGVLTMEEFITKLEGANLPEIKDLKTRKVYNKEDGELDYERMMAGNPNYYCKTITEKAEGNPEITVVIETTGSCDVSATDLLWRGAAAIALVKVLEERGYRTEIWVVSGATIYTNHYDRGVVPTVCLKKPGEPLDISTLINTVSGWFFRSEIFGLFATIAEHENEPLNPALGRPYSPTVSELDLITVDQKRIYASGVFSFNGALGLMLEEMRKIADQEE